MTEVHDYIHSETYSLYIKCGTRISRFHICHIRFCHLVKHMTRTRLSPCLFNLFQQYLIYHISFLYMPLLDVQDLNKIFFQNLTSFNVLTNIF